MPPPPAVKDARFAAYLHDAGFSGADLVTSIAIGMAESGLNASAKHSNSNGTTDWGFMQINDVNKPSAREKTNSVWNARKAHSLYAARHGFGDWSTFNSGAYRGHLDAARAAVKQLQTNGPQWERDTVRGCLAGKYDTMGSNPFDSAGNAIGNAKDAITNPLAALPEQIAKIGSNILSVIVALVFVVLGVVILLRSAATAEVRKTVKGVLS